jgi:hypothetical protein
MTRLSWSMRKNDSRRGREKEMETFILDVILVLCMMYLLFRYSTSYIVFFTYNPLESSNNDSNALRDWVYSLIGSS